jgi:hypothetical protein
MEHSSWVFLLFYIVFLLNQLSESDHEPIRKDHQSLRYAHHSI